MTTFSIAKQNVTSLQGGTRVEFDVDPHDSGVCVCRVFHPGTPDNPSDHPNDYVALSFARNGLLLGTRLVDAEVEAEAHERARAQARLTAKGVFQEASEEERKAADEEEARQIEADKALLASPPKVSKFEKKTDEPQDPKNEPQSGQIPGVGQQELASQGRLPSRNQAARVTT